jgi:hypothetical protein
LKERFGETSIPEQVAESIAASLAGLNAVHTARTLADDPHSGSGSDMDQQTHSSATSAPNALFAMRFGAPPGYQHGRPSDHIDQPRRVSSRLASKTGSRRPGGKGDDDDFLYYSPGESGDSSTGGDEPDHQSGDRQQHQKRSAMNVHRTTRQDQLSFNPYAVHSGLVYDMAAQQGANSQMRQDASGMRPVQPPHQYGLDLTNRQAMDVLGLGVKETQAFGYFLPQQLSGGVAPQGLPTFYPWDDGGLADRYSFYYPPHGRPPLDGGQSLFVPGLTEAGTSPVNTDPAAIDVVPGPVGPYGQPPGQSAVTLSAYLDGMYPTPAMNPQQAQQQAQQQMDAAQHHVPPGHRTFRPAQEQQLQQQLLQQPPSSAPLSNPSAQAAQASRRSSPGQQSHAYATSNPASAADTPTTTQGFGSPTATVPAGATPPVNSTGQDSQQNETYLVLHALRDVALRNPGMLAEMSVDPRQILALTSKLPWNADFPAGAASNNEHSGGNSDRSKSPTDSTSSAPVSHPVAASPVTNLASGVNSLTFADASRLQQYAVGKRGSVGGRATALASVMHEDLSSAAMSLPHMRPTTSPINVAGHKSASHGQHHQHAIDVRPSSPASVASNHTEDSHASDGSTASRKRSQRPDAEQPKNMLEVKKVKQNSQREHSSWAPMGNQYHQHGQLEKVPSNAMQEWSTSFDRGKHQSEVETTSTLTPRGVQALTVANAAFTNRKFYPQVDPDAASLANSAWTAAVDKAASPVSPQHHKATHAVRDDYGAAAEPAYVPNEFDFRPLPEHDHQPPQQDHPDESSRIASSSSYRSAAPSTRRNDSGDGDGGWPPVGYGLSSALGIDFRVPQVDLSVVAEPRNKHTGQFGSQATTPSAYGHGFYGGGVYPEDELRGFDEIGNAGASRPDNAVAPGAQQNMLSPFSRALASWAAMDAMDTAMINTPAVINGKSNQARDSFPPHHHRHDDAAASASEQQRDVAVTGS